jgi:hypothetical protein
MFMGYDWKYIFYWELKHVYDEFPKYHTTFLLGDFSAKVGKENIFKPKILNDSLHETSNYNGSRVINFATLKISQ